jgi:hypothetical protein
MTPRDQLIDQIHHLTDDQVDVLLKLTAMITPPAARSAVNDDHPYNEANDPTVGLFAGDPDLATRSKDIIRDELGRKDR